MKTDTPLYTDHSPFFPPRARSNVCRSGRLCRPHVLVTPALVNQRPSHHSIFLSFCSRFCLPSSVASVHTSRTAGMQAQSLPEHISIHISVLPGEVCITLLLVVCFRSPKVPGLEVDPHLAGRALPHSPGRLTLRKTEEKVTIKDTW